MSSRDRARLVMSEHPEFTGADLARELGVSPERGRTLRREVLAEGTPAEGPGATVTELRPVVGE